MRVSLRFVVRAGSSALFAFILAVAARANTITVTGTGDTIAVDGVVTLREALTAANTNAASGDAPAGDPGLDTIAFNIPGPGPHTITLTGGSLPFITDPVLIDGFTQPGAVSGANRALQIEIDGNNASFVLEIEPGGSGSTIRGLAINNFFGTGIDIDQSSNNTISANYIGLNPAGTALGGSLNTSVVQDGIAVFSGGGGNATGNVIGGSAPGAGNVISLNATFWDGIDAGGNPPALVDNLLVAGNFIGTDATGMVGLGSSNQASVFIGNATHSTIGGNNGTPGGACSGACNLISDGGSSVFVTGPETDGITISGNYLGTDVTGATSFTQTCGALVNISSAFGLPLGTILVGGTTPATRNLISQGSCATGVEVDGLAPPAQLTVKGNYIGTDVSGTKSIAAMVRGIFVNGGSAVTIGGPNAGDGNVISGSLEEVTVVGATGVVVESNILGPAVGGSAPLTGLAYPAGGASVEMYDGAGPTSGNQIGAPTPGGPGGNVMAFHSGGINVTTSGTGNSFFSNSIFSTTVIPIDLGGDGPTPNDDCDADSGANQLQNFPVLTSAAPSPGALTVAGTLDSTANQTYSIEFFSNPPGGSPQATTPLGHTTVTTDASCNASFTVTLPAVATNSTITALATDALGNTSELSAAIPTLLPAVQVAKSFNPASIKSFGTTTLTVTISNPNASAVNGVAFTDSYPTGLVNAASPGATSNCGGTATAITGGTSLGFSGGTIPANGTCVVSVLLTTTPSSGPSVTNTLPAGAVTSSNAFPSANPATATLSVDVSTIPTISPLGLFALAFLLAAVALLLLRRTS